MRQNSMGVFWGEGESDARAIRKEGRLRGACPRKQITRLKIRKEREVSETAE